MPHPLSQLASQVPEILYFDIFEENFKLDQYFDEICQKFR